MCTPSEVRTADLHGLCRYVGMRDELNVQWILAYSGRVHVIKS